MSEPIIVQGAAQAIRGRLPKDFVPRVGLTLGTGLSGLAEAIAPLARIPYAEIPGLPLSTVQSHAGELILG
ncbi:MAG: purine-nucleoside phosphorylase, partial [Desulfarculus sp.]|nr:purine-nucleoside phosphorylase [Desulfarculus sp.]